MEIYLRHLKTMKDGSGITTGRGVFQPSHILETRWDNTAARVAEYLLPNVTSEHVENTGTRVVAKAATCGETSELFLGDSSLVPVTCKKPILHVSQPPNMVQTCTIH